jgi:hypothetical protein
MTTTRLSSLLDGAGGRHRKSHRAPTDEQTAWRWVSFGDPLPRLTFAGFTRVRSDLDSEVPKFATIPFTVSAGQSAEGS